MRLILLIFKALHFIIIKNAKGDKMDGKLENMKIYLLDRNLAMTESWQEYFKDMPNFEIVCDDFAHFMEHNQVDCVVSPANSFGLMDGGYDLAITKWFGVNLPRKVQQYILSNFYGEQPVGTSIIIDTDNDGVKLIHTPTMRSPSRIRDPLVIYQCMRTCLMTALSKGINSIVIPAFGGAAGEVEYGVIANMMYRAYKQLLDPPYYLNWAYVNSSSFRY